MPPLTIRVRFATNRNRVSGSDLFGNTFEGGDSRHYVTGSIDVVRLSNLPDTGWKPVLGSLVIDPPTAALTTVTPTGTPATTPATGMLAFVQDRKDAEDTAGGAAGFGLVLIPGFASTFTDSMRRAAQIAHAYKAADVFCFSWPANGIVDLDNYKLDRVDAQKSGPAMADALAHLFITVGGMAAADRPRLHIVAHSMGNYALRGAVQVIKSAKPELIQHHVFEGAILAAADEDLDVLSDGAKLSPLLGLARRVTVYRAGGDLALAISQNLNGPRLGHWGPDNLETLPTFVTSIDCSDVATTQGDHGESHFSHQYYRLSPCVIRDIVQVLAGIPPDQISGRLDDLGGSAGGRAYWLPFDSSAGV